MNDLLMCLFAGRGDWHKEPPPKTTNLMDKITYGTRLKVTVSIEELK